MVETNEREKLKTDPYYYNFLVTIGLKLIIRDPDSIRNPVRIRSENRISRMPGSESG